jgi:hypothetical protein
MPAIKYVRVPTVAAVGESSRGAYLLGDLSYFLLLILMCVKL